MRIRTVKPEFWQDEEIAELSPEAALLALGLLNFADDEGYFRFIPKLIESTIFPLRALSVSIHALLTELSSMGYIKVHNGSNGKQFGHIKNFKKHQKVNRPSESKFAPFINDSTPSLNNHGAFTEASLAEQGTGNREQGTGNREMDQGSGKETAHTQPAQKRIDPSIEDCEDGAVSMAPKNHSDLAASIGRGFYGIYAAQQWRTTGGADILKNSAWKHKLRTYLENELRTEISKAARSKSYHSQSEQGAQQPTSRSRANGTAAGAGINVPIL